MAGSGCAAARHRGHRGQARPAQACCTARLAWPACPAGPPAWPGALLGAKCPLAACPPRPDHAGRHELADQRPVVLAGRGGHAVRGASALPSADPPTRPHGRGARRVLHGHVARRARGREQRARLAAAVRAGHGGRGRPHHRPGAAPGLAPGWPAGRAGVRGRSRGQLVRPGRPAVRGGDRRGGRGQLPVRPARRRRNPAPAGGLVRGQPGPAGPGQRLWPAAHPRARRGPPAPVAG